MSSPPSSEVFGSPKALDLTGAADNSGAVGGDDIGADDIGADDSGADDIGADDSGADSNGKGSNRGDGNSEYDHNCGDPRCVQYKEVSRRLLIAKNTELGELREEKEGLEKEVAHLRQKERERRGKRRHVRIWPHLLWKFLQTGEGDYDEIYRQSCKEENMSSRKLYVHPNLVLVESGNRRLQPQTYSEENVKNSSKFLRFLDLPANIQAKIFRLWLHLDGRLVHCLSRLDPYQPPTEVPSSASGLPNRFYWSRNRHCSITKDTQDPKDILRLLLVCKSFYFRGVHAFYGLNTFAFSSLGEFCRFCTGIGTARAARLQHIELTWMGNQYLTNRPEEEESFAHGSGGKQDRAAPKGRWFSRRTSPLVHLQEMPRLLTMVVFINESGKEYIRRNYEPIRHKDQEPIKPQDFMGLKLQDYMSLKTVGQPNERWSRSLRTVQGLDYLHSLRGLDWIRFYDLWQGLKNGGARFPVHDTSFVADVNSTVTMPKAPFRTEEAQLKKLIPLPYYGDWVPSEADWEIVDDFYEEPSGDDIYGATRHYYGVEDEYIRVDSDSGEDKGDDSDGGGDDSDGGNDGDDEGGGYDDGGGYDEGGGPHNDGNGNGDHEEEDGGSNNGDGGGATEMNGDDTGDVTEGEDGGEPLQDFSFLRLRDELSRFPRSLIITTNIYNEQHRRRNGDNHMGGSASRSSAGEAESDPLENFSFLRREGGATVLRSSWDATMGNNEDRDSAADLDSDPDGVWEFDIGSVGSSSLGSDYGDGVRSITGSVQPVGEDPWLLISSGAASSDTDDGDTSSDDDDEDLPDAGDCDTSSSDEDIPDAVLDDTSSSDDDDMSSPVRPASDEPDTPRVPSHHDSLFVTPGPNDMQIEHEPYPSEEPDPPATPAGSADADVEMADHGASASPPARVSPKRLSSDGDSPGPKRHKGSPGSE